MRHRIPCCHMVLISCFSFKPTTTLCFYFLELSAEMRNRTLSCKLSRPSSEDLARAQQTVGRAHAWCLHELEHPTIAWHPLLLPLLPLAASRGEKPFGCFSDSALGRKLAVFSLSVRDFGISRKREENDWVVFSSH